MRFVSKGLSIALVLFAGWIAACSTETLDPVGASISTVVIAPATATVAVGASITLNAELRDNQGNPVAGYLIRWSSEDPSVADVSASGVVIGHRVGSVLIAASAQGKDALAIVTVNPTPVTTVRMSAANRSMFVGESFQLTADPLDASGALLAGRQVTWSSTNESVATVTQAGLVTAVAAGGAIVTATAEGKTGVASITISSVPVASIDVTPAQNDLVVGQTTQLTAQALAASGTPLNGRALSWSTGNAAVATVTSAGLVTAIAPGNATISASSEGRSASAAISVSPRPVSAVIVSPDQVTITVGQTAQLSTIVTDDRGLVLTGRPMSFSSSHVQVATVSATGLVTGVGAGGATITVMSEGKTGTASVSILPEAVASVEIGPQPASVIVGQSTQLSAIARNASGQPLNGRTVIWSSGAPGLASISSSGVVTGLAPGTAVAIANVDGVVGSAVVTVRDIPVFSVTVTPPTTTIPQGQVASLTAMVRDAGGNALSGRVVAWTTSDNTVATVSAGGTVTGVGTGAATITATSEGQSGSASVTITPVAVASVQITPPFATLFAGDVAQFTATPRSAAGQALTGRAVTWDSDTPGVATVSTSGLVTAVATGQAFITATIDGVQASVTTTVVPVPVASVTVTPTPTTTGVGQSVSLTATTRDAAGNVLTGRAITWSSSASAVATVSSNGTVTGIGAGTATISATSEGRTGSSLLTVTMAAPLPVASVSISPASVNLLVGATLGLTAATLDSAGNTLTGRAVTWSTSDATIATVDATGLLTAVAAGSASITASSEGQSGSASVTVSVAPQVPTSISVTPASATVNVAWTSTLGATVLDASGNPIAGAPITWSTSDPGVALVSASGVVTGVATGTAVITASSGSLTNTSSITVQLAPVDHIVVSPTNPAIDVLKTVQLTATLYDLYNNVLAGRVVSWSSADSSKVMVDSNGLALGLRKGTVVISATSEGKTGTTNVRVK